MDKFKAWLSGPEDGRKLGLFRIIFGICMIFRMIEFYRGKFIEQGILAPKFHFTYEGFHWVQPLPNMAMQAILAAMLVSAILLTLGRWMRAACAVLAVGSWYFLFLEKAYFNNHLYLFLLIYILLCFTEADRFFSWNKKPATPREVPRWQVFILQLQVMVVYFYGGVAKLNPDWLFRQQPVRAMLTGGPFAGNEFAIQFFSVGGLLIDILAPILLWWKPARRWAIWAFLFFHVTNSINFHDIGVFPFVMIGALLLYLDNQETGWLFRLFEKKEKASPAISPKNKKSAPVAQPQAAAVAGSFMFKKPAACMTGFLVVYFAWQLLFPLRGYFLPNPQDFTTIGNRFSWHMKIDNRSNAETILKVRNLEMNQEVVIPLDKMLNNVQIAHLATDPRSVLKVATYAAEVAKKFAPGQTEVHSYIRFSYNGREVQDFIRPEVDLTKERISPMKKIDWLVLPTE